MSVTAQEQPASGENVSDHVLSLNAQHAATTKFEGLLAKSPEMLEVFATCERVAASEAPVLVIGETGTGKELVARAIHKRSGRKGRFVALNSASVSPALIEAELFGYERGAFTGADRAKIGAVRHAEAGTLFLDEIGDLQESGQRSLLRFLQEGTVRPVGGYEEVKVDVRVIAATHVQLSDAVARGTFREDLYYRLNVLRIPLPAVRARGDDARLLLSHFIKRIAQKYKRETPIVSEEFWQALEGHPLPGNVRQLQSLAERIVVSGRKRPLRAADFVRYVDVPAAGQAATRNAESTAAHLQSTPPLDEPLHAASAQGGVDLSASLGDNVALAVRAVEREYLIAALTRTNGRVADAAFLAGISRRTLHRKLSELDIDRNQFRLRNGGTRG
jgi:DNA-binding NtrC family response regulator